MILIDTGALYALTDRHDKNHQHATTLYRKFLGRETLGLSLPVLTESWLLIEARLGRAPAHRLWQAVLGGAFDLLEVGSAELQLALEIETKYADVGFGLVDAICFALCERHKIEKVFTYDQKHFSIYRPTFVSTLNLLRE